MKLPKTQDILFTIRIHLDPLEALDRRADRKVIAEQFVKTINLMKDEELAYKGLDKGRDKLIARLMEVTQDA